MNEHAITFTPDGTGHALYTEAIDLAAIGELAIRRATSIEFDGHCQLWHVFPARGGNAYFSNPSRQACLDWERCYLEQQEDRKHELPTGHPAPRGTARTTSPA